VVVLRAAHPGPPGDVQEPRELAVFDAAAGWRLDNFEGLAWRSPDQLFLVSDDNASSLQRSLLVHLKLR
jgi:hypothetical protein